MVAPLNLREDFLKQSGIVKHLKSGSRPTLSKNPDNLFLNSLDTDLMDLWRHRAHGFPRFRFNGVPEPRSEPDRAQYSKLVFLEAPRRLTDGADNSGIDVLPAGDIIEYCLFDRIEQEAVDREVPTQHVRFCVGEHNASRPASVDIRFI